MLPGQAAGAVTAECLLTRRLAHSGVTSPCNGPLGSDVVHRGCHSQLGGCAATYRGPMLVGCKGTACLHAGAASAWRSSPTLSLRAGDSCRDTRAPWGDCIICRMFRPEGEAVRQRTPSARWPAGDLLRLAPCLHACGVSKSAVQVRQEHGRMCG